MIEAVEDGCSHGFIERDQVDDHAGFLLDRTAHEDFQHIVVPVAVGVVALAVCGEVLACGEGFGVEAMAGLEHVAAAEVGVAHLSPRYSAKISGVS